MDVEKVKRQQELYPEVDSVISKTLDNTEDGYRYLYNLKGSIPKELYAFYLRRIWGMKTEGLSFELALQMFEGVEPEDIMYEEELDAIKQFDDYITIYRGTSITEEVPRLCWTLRESVATNNSDFAHGRLFKATVPKKDILLYITKDGAEEEVVVHVTEGYEIVDYSNSQRKW